MILVVDDHKDSAIVLKRLLMAEGFEAEAVFTAQAALAFMAVTPVSAAILDYHLPDSNGLLLYRAMQADVALRHIPVMVFSANDGDVREKALGEGITAWITKGSLDVALLYTQLARLLGPPASKLYASAQYSNDQTTEVC